MQTTRTDRGIVLVAAALAIVVASPPAAAAGITSVDAEIDTRLDCTESGDATFECRASYTAQAEGETLTGEVDVHYRAKGTLSTPSASETRSNTDSCSGLLRCSTGPTTVSFGPVEVVTFGCEVVTFSAKISATAQGTVSSASEDEGEGKTEFVCS